ncbi:hypothetical protein JCM17380_06380 [Desulfosporosinus burensis]
MKIGFLFFVQSVKKISRVAQSVGVTKLSSGLQRLMSWVQMEIEDPQGQPNHLREALAEQAAKRETVCFS